MADPVQVEPPSVTTPPQANPTPAPNAAPVAPATPAKPAVAAAPVADKPLALGGGGEDKPVTTPADWPENWPDVMAGGDAKLAAQYRRYHSPAAIGKAFVSLRQRMDSGELARARPEGDPDDPAVKQALTEWRATAGIPEKPDGYLDKVPDGIVFGENDKPMLDGFLKDMHAKDVPPPYVHEALRWYKANEEWGGSQDLATELYSARLADGTPLGDHPAFLRWAASIGRDLGLHHTVVGASGSPQAGAARQGEIEKLMSDSRSAYWNGPQSEALKGEYRKILEAEEKVKTRRVA